MTENTKNKNWHWVSYLEFVEKNELSIFALSETLCAIGLFVWISFQGHSLHLVIAVCLTPFLLLATNKSRNLGVYVGGKFIFRFASFAERYIEFYFIRLFSISEKVLLGIKNSVIKKGCGLILNIALFPFVYMFLFAAIIIAYPILASLTLLIRVFSTTYTVFRYPMLSIKSIPQNWWRFVGCIDVFCVPEPIPGSYERIRFLKLAKKKTSSSGPEAFLSDFGTVINVFTGFYFLRNLSAMSTWRNFLREDHNKSDVNLLARIQHKFKGSVTFLMLVVSDLIFKLLYMFVYIVPTIFYRWSIKGTAVVYLPFIWVLQNAVSGNLIGRFFDIREMAFFKFRRWLSAIVIFFVGSKVFASNLWNMVIENGGMYLSTEFIHLFVAPSYLPKWQIASALNSVIVFIIFFLADAVLVKHERTGNQCVEPVITFIMRALWFIGGILSLYTISVLIYNVFSIEWNLIRIDENWFPFGMLDEAKYFAE